MSNILKISEANENSKESLYAKRSYQSKLEKVVCDTQRSWFGERYVGATLSALKCHTEIQETIRDWMKSKKHFLIYSGNVGIGKTYVLSAMVEWIITTFRSYRIWEERDVFSRLRASMDDMKGDYIDHLKYLIDDEIVIINDVGSQGYTQWREEVFFDLIDIRYNSMLPTIITTNFSGDDFKKVFHKRIHSRLFSKENTIIDDPDGLDLREIGM